MLHRFRRAMVRLGRDKLKGLVEVDETYLSITDRKNPATCRAQEQHHQSVDGHGGGDRGAQGVWAHPVTPH